MYIQCMYLNMSVGLYVHVCMHVRMYNCIYVYLCSCVMYVIIIYYLLYIQYFPQDYIKGGGVDQWYPMFSLQCT